MFVAYMRTSLSQHIKYHLHRHGVVHFDLKLDNIMVKHHRTGTGSGGGREEEEDNTCNKLFQHNIVHES